MQRSCHFDLFRLQPGIDGALLPDRKLLAQVGRKLIGSAAQRIDSDLDDLRSEFRVLENGVDLIVQLVDDRLAASPSGPPSGSTP